MAHSLFFISQMLAITALSLISSLFFPFCPSIHSLYLQFRKICIKREHIATVKFQTKKSKHKVLPTGIFQSLRFFKHILGNSSQWSIGVCFWSQVKKKPARKAPLFKTFVYPSWLALMSTSVHPQSVMQNAFVVTKPRQPLLYWLRNPRHSPSFSQCNAIIRGISQWVSSSEFCFRPVWIAFLCGTQKKFFFFLSIQSNFVISRVVILGIRSIFLFGL